MDTTYRSDVLASRISGMAGTPAEEAFHRYMASQGRVEGRDYIRTGYDRTDTSSAFLAGLPPEERHRPDFIQQGGHWWECQGFGAGQVLRVKEDKLSVLWNHYAKRGEAVRQVRYFVYDSSRDEAMVMPIQTLLWAIHQPESTYVEEMLDGRKNGWEIPADLLRSRFITDALNWAKEVTKEARKEREKADEQAASATRRMLRAAGVRLDEPALTVA